MPLTVRCSSCLSQYSVADKYAGRKVKCAKCGEICRIPPLGAGAAQSASPAVAAAPGGSPESAPRGGGIDLSALAHAEATAQSIDAPAPASAPALCPGCGGLLAGAQVICTRCGYDRRTGRALATAVQTAPAGPPPAPAQYRRPEKVRGGGDMEVEAGFWERNAVWLVVWGCGAPLLPLAGRQFVVLTIFGDYSVFVGIPFGIIASIVYLTNQRYFAALLAFVLPAVALAIAFAAAANMPLE